MESTKEMLLPRPAAIDGIPPSLESVAVDSESGPKLFTDAPEEQDTHVSNGLVPHNVYASDPNLTMLPDNSIRARLRRILSTHRFQVTLIIVVLKNPKFQLTNKTHLLRCLSSHL